MKNEGVVKNKLDELIKSNKMVHTTKDSDKLLGGIRMLEWVLEE